ncbi:hypothetical protein NP493_527g02008 [Ridgeia piscesae]|uniref:Uncharacterized protein n=1 Tax=Ridgeia piscesae TaxID=27915 RepID=A0AAD9KW65_RIDPI|nr:hypothetical protein NP493_527g02008 [Ridgeia piscesae]
MLLRLRTRQVGYLLVVVVRVLLVCHLEQLAVAVLRLGERALLRDGRQPGLRFRRRVAALDLVLLHVDRQRAAAHVLLAVLAQSPRVDHRTVDHRQVTVDTITILVDADLDWLQIVVVVLQLLAVVHRRVVPIAGPAEGTAVVLVGVWVAVVQQRLLRVATLPCPTHHHMAFKGTVQHVTTW